MTFKKLLSIASFVVVPALLAGQGQGLDPAEILKPLKDSWSTYNGDYSGKRYSLLTQINQSTVKNLTLAWMSRLTPGPAATPSGRAGAPTLVTGGEGTGDFPSTGGTVKGSVIQVEGTLYVTMPDNIWAVDAR